MAERRMFTKKITESDAFLDMPTSSQALYFHLSMSADDDGFVNSPRSIQRKVGASVDDLNLLLAKKFILDFESGVIVIKHWKMHNYIQSDRYKPTDYKEEKSLLTLNENKSYSLNTEGLSTLDTKCIQNVSIGKDRLGKDSIGKDNILPPLSPTGEKKKSNKVDFDALIMDKGFEPILEDSIREWLEYKTQKKDKYTEVGFKKLLTQIENKVKELGTDKVIEVIDESMARNYTGIIFNLATNGFSQGKKDTESEFFSRWSNA